MRALTRKTEVAEYVFLEEVGQGAFGSVFRARNKTTESIVAVKVMRKRPSDVSHLREFKLMKRIEQHPNIVQFLGSFLGMDKNLCFVMEYMDGGNLCQLLDRRRQAIEPMAWHDLRSLMRQIIAALSHIHTQGIFHRDVKPENLLLKHTTPMTIKLADFGLARTTKSRLPCTQYVSTRWYRAPEVLLHASSYSSPVDLWAFGAICAEMVTLRPLFPGRSEIDQLFRICTLLGTPAVTKRHVSSDQGGGRWPEGVKLAGKLGFEFPEILPQPLSNVIPNADGDFIDFLARFLVYNPARRLQAKEALEHPFLRELPLEEVPQTSAPTTSQTTFPTTTTPLPSRDNLKIPVLPSTSKFLAAEAARFELPSIPLSPLVVFPEHTLSEYPFWSDKALTAEHDDTFLPPAPRAFQEETRSNKPRPSRSTPLPSRRDVQHDRVKSKPSQPTLRASPAVVATKITHPVPNANISPPIPKPTSTLAGLLFPHAHWKRRPDPVAPKGPTPSTSQSTRLFRLTSRTSSSNLKHRRSSSMKGLYDEPPTSVPSPIPTHQQSTPQRQQGASVKEKIHRLSFWSKKNQADISSSDTSKNDYIPIVPLK